MELDSVGGHLFMDELDWDSNMDGIGSRMASGFFGCCEGAGDLTVGGVKSDSWIVDQDEDTLEKGPNDVGG
eukprot:scaffold118670_cov37-Cyclotella_meneghiniana.AAC.2